MRGHGRYRAVKCLLVLAALAGAVVLLSVWSICRGSVALDLEDMRQAFSVWSSQTSQDVETIRSDPARQDMVRRIVWDIRLPRVLAAVILGGSLSVSGFLLQTFFSNPIAGPFVLGISSGARMAVCLVMLLVLGQGAAVTSAGLVLAAFGGALVSTGLVLLAAVRVKAMSSLVVCGVMLGYICSAVTDFAVTFAEDANIVNLHNWSVGSFSGITWENIRVMGTVVFPAMVLAWVLAKPISAYQMGEAYARSVGVGIRRFRLELILLSSLLSACVTAFAGPVSFVGIAVPHLVKRLMGTAKPLWMIPGCFLGGGAFCLLSDFIARTVFSPRELGISSVTALLGAPVVIGMMLHPKKP
ncbi:MAG: iron ABC transporter permease [Lachnospiraceae bacterium]|nr:iron ABC transporter permease [Lachnospiraceae bacterium]